MIRTPARTGATLTEVLVAIFVMAIGLLALLTLFPLGALSMAQAIKDNRTAHSGKNAFAIAEALNIHSDSAVLNNGLAPMGSGNATTYFLNPYPTLAQLPTGVAQPLILQAPDLTAIGYDGPSYPVFIDPVGWKYSSSPFIANIPIPTAGGFSSIPRQPLSVVPASATPLNPNAATQSLVRWCTLSDDITFSEDATPSTNTGAVQRENRYTWAWLLRRPKANDPTVVDVTVVVYSGRSVTSLGETPFPNPALPGLGTPANPFVLFDPSSKFVDITYSGTKPSIRTGSWILDATMEYYDNRPAPFNPAGLPVNVPDPHGFFYRVVGVTELSSNSMRLELQTSPKRASYYLPNPSLPPDPTTNAPVPYGVLIVMENVVEVFEKGPGWQP